MAINKIIFLALFIGLTSQLSLIPDAYNPIQLKFPTKDNVGQTLIFRFSFSDQSQTISNRQVFGVRLPTNLGLTLNDKTTSPYTCSINDETNNQLINSEVAISDETNHLFCRLSRLSPLVTNVTYSLSFTFGFKFTSSNFFSNVGLFVATSELLNRQYFANNPVFGTLGQYNDLFSNNNSMVDINSIAIDNKTIPGSDIVAGSICDISFVFLFNTNISSNDINIVITFPNMFLAPTGVDSVSINNSGLGAALSGVLSFSNFGDSGVIIKGILEDFVQGRTFRLNIKGFKVKAVNSDNLQVNIFYKNSYSLLSYRNFSIISKHTRLIISANHPEKWDIWRNGAWPFVFSINSDYDLDGGWLKIQHSNALDGVNRLSFVAASCDFSNNSLVDNNFGKRNNCFAARPDFEYTSRSTTTSYNGSAIFFKIRSLKKDQTFIFTVWAFADNCGGDDFNKYDLINNLSNSSVKFNFIASMYSDINVKELGEARFTTPYAVSSSTSMANICFNAMIQGSYNSFANSYDKNLLNTVTIDNEQTAGTHDIALFRENYDWGISYQDANCNNCWANDISGTNFAEQFLYSKTDKLGSGSYFLLKSNLKKYAGDYFYQFFATGYSKINDNNSVINSKWVFRFSKNWFSAGDSNCYLSWGLKYGYLDNQIKLFNKDYLTSTQNVQNNLISTSTQVAGQQPTINLSESFLIDSEEGFKITSVKYIHDNPKFSIINILDTPLNNNEAILGLFTTCLKWRTDLQPIKSLYTYIDIQWQWIYLGNADNKNQPTKNNRFIKLYPEGGVFQNYKSFDNTALSSTNPVTIHYAWQNARSDGRYTGICMIEINGEALSIQFNSDSNSLGIWLYHATLFETDYNDTSATYPVSPFANVINAWGLQSAVPQSSENQIYSNRSTNNMIKDVINDLISIDRDNNKSYYHFMLGSFLLLTGIKSNNLTNTPAGITKNNLFIPIYCPIIGPDYFTNPRLPSITAAWLNMGSFNSKILLNHFIAYKRENTSTVIILNSDSNKLNIPGIFTSASLKFNQYSSINPEGEKTLFIFNSTKKTIGINTDCSAHLLFLNTKVEFKESELMFNGLQNAISYLSGLSKFYIYGKEFSSAFLTSATTAININAISYNSNISPYYVQGITRPTPDKLFDLISDSIAYSCVSSRYDEGGALTNLINDGSYNFILDFNSELNSYLPNVTLSADKNESNFINDIASHYKLTFSTPNILPSNSIITFQTDITPSSDTVCGIYENTYSSQCTNNNDNTISCTTNIVSSNFQICCYGYKVKSNIILTSLSISLPSPSVLSDYITTTIYSIDKQLADTTKNPFSFTNSLTSNSLTISARVTTISYLNMIQSFGLGYAKIAILLPREPVRNMKLSIFGDFKDFAVSNINTNCLATFDDKSESDILIEKCDISNIYDMTGTIDVTFKNFIYKCGMSFSKTLYLKLWPIRALDYKSDTYQNKSYKVTATKNLEALLSNIDENTFSANDMLTQPLIIDQWDTLCPVSSIIPSIPGEFAEYIFNFNIDAYKDQFVNNKPNELQIFYDYKLFDLGSEIGCYIQDQFANCQVTLTGILTIRYPSGLPYNTGKPLVVKLTGVRNPEIPDSHRFGCSINYSNWNTGVRTQIITGSGKVNGAVSMKATRVGQVRVYYIPDIDANIAQRKISNHYLRVSIDQITGLSKGSFTVDKTPVFYIIFPQAYDLNLYSSNITGSISTFFYDNSNKLVETVLPIISIVNSFNRVVITLKDAINITDKWSNFYIKLNGVSNPQDSYEKDNATGSFLITLTNSDESTVFRTHTNLNTQYTPIINSSITDPYINYTRGAIFYTDNNKFIINITDNMIINPGRFSKYTMSIIENNSLNQSNAMISLNDNTFVLMNDSYELSSTNPDGVDFFIGVPCNTIPGNHVLTFNLKSDNSVLFAPLPVIMANINSSSKGSINYSAGKTVPQGGSLWILYNLSEPNVDALIIGWTKNNLNDSTANLSAALLPKGTMPRTIIKFNNIFSSNTFSTFSITNISKVNTLQTFTTRAPNNCYSWASTTISFEINGLSADITPSYDMSNNFQYYNSSQDASLKHNSIAIIFNPPVAPAYLYCSLMCAGNDIQSTTSIKNKYDNNEKSQSYTAYIENNNPITILFSNLLRNIEYRWSCILESTQADKNARTGTKMIKDNLTLSSTKVLSTIKALDTYPTICNEITFSRLPSAQRDIINKCQLTISSNGYANNGCLVCTDNHGQYTTPGIYLSKTQCVQQQIASRLRLLQNTTIQTTLTNIPTPINETVKLCLIQNPNCATNPNMTIDEYKNQFITQVINYNNTLLLDASSTNVTIDKIISYNDTLPDLSKIVITNFTYDMNSNIEWVATYPTPLKCKWMYRIDSFISLPTFDYIWGCSNINCGSTYVSSSGSITGTDKTKIFSLELGSRYNIYYACYSDIPNPGNGNVGLVKYFTTPAANNVIVNIGGVHNIYYLWSFLLLLLIL